MNCLSKGSFLIVFRRYTMHEQSSYSPVATPEPLPSSYITPAVRFIPEKPVGIGGSAEVYAGLYAAPDTTGEMTAVRKALKYMPLSDELFLRGRPDIETEDFQPSNIPDLQTEIQDESKQRFPIALKRFVAEYSCLQAAGQVIGHDADPHPNIMQIDDFEVDIEGERIVTVMPYYLGDSLRSRMRAPLSVTETLGYIQQAASALQHLHEHGVIHRDVKPANMLFASDGRLVLADFDCAVRTREATRDWTQQRARNKVLGTTDYIAPEQLYIDGSVPASDQYALAAVAYHMITGRPLFRGNDSEKAFAHLTAEPESFRKRMHGCVSALAQAIEPCIMKALSKEPIDRYDSVAEFAQALEDAVASAQQRTREATPSIERGTLAAMRGDAGKAEEEFLRAVTMDPGNITARYMQATCLRTLNASNTANQAFQEVLSLTPRTPHDFVLQGRAAVALGDYDTAQVFFNHAQTFGCDVQEDIDGVNRAMDERRQTIGRRIGQFVRSIFGGSRPSIQQKQPPSSW
jgi:serine/threonine protein kinase